MHTDQRCVAIALSILALVCAAAAGLGQTGSAEPPASETVAKLIAQLGAADFRSRQEASNELAKLGKPVLPLLRQAAAAKTELEVKRRLELVVIRIQAAAVEKLVQAYCVRQGLAREDVESWTSALAPAGRMFRYTLAAAPAKDNQRALPERHAFVFVDPDKGNTYDVKLMPGGDKTLNQRTFAILRLMDIKVANRDHAQVVMAGLFAMGSLFDIGDGHDDPLKVRLVQVQKGESSSEPTTYFGEHPGGLRVVMTVDEDGYVTQFRVGNIR